MAEGELFGVALRRREPLSHPELPALIALARSLHALGLMPSYGPGDHGNLSLRTPEGFLITARQTRKDALTPAQFVHVVGGETAGVRAQLVCEGACLPSTDALMHHAIYAQRPDASVIVHGHDAKALSQAAALALPLTRVSAQTNSLTLIEEVRALCAHHDYLLTRDHGFIALGSSIEAVRALILRHFTRARGASAGA